MDILEALLAEHSKSQMKKIVQYIDRDPTKFAELMKVFLGDTYRLSQRAAGVLNYCAENHHELVKPYFGRLIDQLEREGSHVAVRRNVVRMLQFLEIPRRYRGRIFGACYNLVNDPSQPVAVKVFAMSTAARIAENEPDLLNELKLVVDKYLPHSTAGFKSRARKIFKSA